MAKDVNLSSQEWLDIVFDGKNKDYGAYVLRANTVRRNNKAVVIVLAILAVIVVTLILAVNGVFSPAEEDANTGVEQQDMSLYNGDEEEMEEEEQQIEIPEEKPEELPKEEIINSIQNTEIDIVKDEEMKNEVKEQSELLDDNRQMGAVDQDKGIDDNTREALTKEVVAEPEKPKPEPEVKKADDQIYNTANVQQQPQFPGGEAAMYQWLSSHINYPAAAAEEGVQGRVTVQFMVDKDGSIKNVKVMRGKHPALDKEAQRVVSAMPKWNPGRNNGQPVKVTYVLPVTFKLQQ